MMQLHFGILGKVPSSANFQCWKGILAMDDRNGFCRQGSGVWRSLTDGDFQEEDVWAVLHENRDSTPNLGENLESHVSVKEHLPSATRMIPRTAITTPSDEAIGSKRQSAPVKIPEWSKASSKKSTKGSSKNLSWAWLGDDEAVSGYGDGQHDGDAVDEDDDDGWYNSMVPPHEILARRLAGSQISSFSVFEGVGRKLKGRDLRKVRNAVLTKTGFLE